MSKIPIVEKCVRSSISIIGFPLTLFQTIISKYHIYRYKPIGKFVNVGSRNLHAVVTGQGTPTVILESGMGGCSLDWSLVQPEISNYATVISYDRAGFGWSTKLMDQPTCKNYVDDLRCLLKNMNLKPPYLLVGHSYGGMIMRLFSTEYPDEVMGLNLIDATHESRYLPSNMNENRIKQQEQNKKQFRLGYLLSPIAIPRIIKRHIGANRLPSNVQKIVHALGYRNNTFKAVYSELLYAVDSAIQLQSAHHLSPDLPVIVLSAGKQNEEWKQGQEELLNLSNHTKQIIVEDSWHSIQIHKPEIVISAVKSLLNYHDNCPL
jgi:pimeloyl-ACP methyl ester carboxylesterase